MISGKYVCTHRHTVQCKAWEKCTVMDPGKVNTEVPWAVEYTSNPAYKKAEAGGSPFEVNFKNLSRFCLKIIE